MSHNWPKNCEKRQNVWAKKLEFLESFGVLEYFGVFSERAEEVVIG